MGDLSKPGQTTNSWLNTMIFQKAWEQIRWDGRYKRHDWTVKVDPDAVFFPQRLRDLVRPHSTPPGAWFYLNCNKYPPSPPGEAKLYGSVEVFSRKAIEAYMRSTDLCMKGLDWRGWGEDFFMQRCMEKLDVMAVHNFGWIGDDRCWPAKCTKQDRVAFHDFKDIDEWFDCWGQSTKAR
uniref:Hexosyltransferase n=1 Tax=Alexandrium catenella TaxID=2925 RepID=A0A7S1RVA9_ALECA